jgi:serine/threonine protein kinase
MRGGGPSAFRSSDRLFEVRRELGSGAFGIVYEVFDREREATLALKALRGIEPAQVARFKQEFRALGDIDHPNLVTYYELFAEDDAWFFTMELVRGSDIVTYVRGAPAADPSGAGSVTATMVRPADPTVTVMHVAAMRSSNGELTSEPTSVPRPLAPDAATGVDWGRLRDVTRQLAGALRALHAAGKLHRDLKPPNVLVSREGRVVVLDFGLVAPVGSQTDIAGTPSYMAPEIAEGIVTPAADWYAVGVILFTAITGRPPFFGTFAEMLREKRRGPPPLPEETPPDIHALCRDLLQPEPEARPGADEVLVRLGGAAPRAAMSRPFVGRAQHLEALRDAFETMRRGHAAAVLLSGRSGNGKSAILRQFLREVGRAQAGALVFEGRCYERESVPYKALDTAMDALFAHLASLPSAEIEPGLPRDAAVIARVFPVAARVDAIRRAAAPAEGLDEAELRAVAFRALRALVTWVARRAPLVLVIDDLHWGDRESAVLLAELLAPPDPPPILLLGAYRSEERAGNAFLDTLTATLARALPGDRLRELAVGELSPGDARALVRALLARGQAHDEEQVAHVAREARGNPFFIGELAEHLREHRELPGLAADADADALQASLDDAIFARVCALAEAPRRLVEIVAVAGKRVPAHVVGRAAGLGAVRRLDEAVIGGLRTARLLRTADTKADAWVDTYHDRIREAVGALLPDVTRRELHARLARAWEESGDADPETLAWHHEQAGDAAAAHRHLVAAARRAAGALAFEHAADLYRRAVALARRTGGDARPLEEALAAALVNGGRRAEAAEVYLSLARTAPPADVLALRCIAAEQLVRSGRVDEGRAAFVEVVEGAGYRWPGSRAAAFAQIAAVRGWLRLRGTRYEERREEDVPPDLLRRIDLFGAVTRGLRAVDPFVGFIFAGRYVLLALSAGEPRRVAAAFMHEGGSLAVTGTRRGPRADRIAAEVEAIARRLGDTRLLAEVELLRAGIGYMCGDWRATRAHAERGDAMIEALGGGGAEYDRTSFALDGALLFLGEVGVLAERALAQAAGAERRGDRFAAADLCVGHAAVGRLYATGDAAGVRADVERVLDGWSRRGFTLQHYGGLHVVLESLIYERRGREAHARCLDAWGDVRGSMALQAQCSAIASWGVRARAALAAAAGAAVVRGRASPLDDALASAAALEKEGAPWGDVLAKLARGGAASIAGAETRAAVLLAEGERAAEACGMALHAAAARRFRGAMLGGAQGARLRDEADDRMKALGVAEPARLAWCLAPGAWAPGGPQGERQGNLT